MRKITYAYSYYGELNYDRKAPPELQASVERALPMLNPTRSQVLTTGNVAPYTLIFGPVRTNPAWIVTIAAEEPEPCSYCGGKGIIGDHCPSCGHAPQQEPTND